MSLTTLVNDLDVILRLLAQQAEAHRPAADVTSPVAAREQEKISKSPAAAVQEFLQKVEEKTGRRVTKTDFWTVAGYKNRTEFERWQRGDPKATKSAARKFGRFLMMEPQEFIRQVDRKPRPAD